MGVLRFHSSLCALLLATAVVAQPVNEARVKAKLAYTLARFTTWPDTAFATPTTPAVLCAQTRSESLSAAFAELKGRPLAGRTVSIVLNPVEVETCHVLFVHDTSDKATVDALPDWATSPILTIGDVERFASRGGMIELMNVNDAVRFDVNIKALQGAQLTLSSQVLRLARQVRN